MSLTRLAVRIAAVRALTGKTLAEDRVFDSTIAPIDAVAEQQPLPFLIVFTDTHERAVTGRDLGHGDDTLELVIEASIASRVTIPLPEGGEEEAVTVPNTDAGLEFTLDVIEAQVVRALVSQSGDWSSIFCGLIPRFIRRASRRGVTAEDGTRFAARQIVLTCDPLADPVAGQHVADGSPWARFIGALEADDEMRPLGLVIRSMIEAPDQTSWGLIGAMLGLSMDEVAATGMAPEVLSDEGDPVQMDEVVVAIEGGPELVLGEQAATDQVV